MASLKIHTSLKSSSISEKKICCTERVKTNSAKALAVSTLVAGLLSIAIGIGVFRTGCWAVVCDSVGGGLVVADGVAVVLWISRMRAPPPSDEVPESIPTSSVQEAPIIQENPSTVGTPGEANKVEVKSPEIEEPYKRTVLDDLREFKDEYFRYIERLSVVVEKDEEGRHYSQEELKRDVDVTLEKYDLRNEAGQQKALEHLKVLNEALPHHLKLSEEHSITFFPVIGIENYLGNNGYINVGLQILAHTRHMDYLLYCPLREKKSGEEEKVLKKMQVDLSQIILDMRKGVAPGKMQIQALHRQINAIEKRYRTEKNDGLFQDVWNLLQPFSVKDYYFKSTPCNDSQMMKDERILVRGTEHHTWLYIKTATGWLRVENDNIKGIELLKEISDKTPSAVNDKIKKIEFVTAR